MHHLPSCAGAEFGFASLIACEKGKNGLLYLLNFLPFYKFSSNLSQLPAYAVPWNIIFTKLNVPKVTNVHAVSCQSWWGSVSQNGSKF